MEVDSVTKISAAMARREEMLEPDEVTAMLQLKKLGGEPARKRSFRSPRCGFGKGSFGTAVTLMSFDRMNWHRGQPAARLSGLCRRIASSSRR
ncbi:UNVERIFIED_ORG: hypothetical protein J2W85_005858 [Ensifer adhaerens]|nr:hypothetical protein [Ensifer adhaerens]